MCDKNIDSRKTGALRALNRLEKRRDVLSNSHEGLMQRLVQFAIKHELQLIVKQLGQVRANRGRQHAHTLENWL